MPGGGPPGAARVSRPRDGAGLRRRASLARPPGLAGAEEELLRIRAPQHLRSSRALLLPGPPPAVEPGLHRRPAARGSERPVQVPPAGHPDQRRAVLARVRGRRLPPDPGLSLPAARGGLAAAEAAPDEDRHRADQRPDPRPRAPPDPDRAGPAAHDAGGHRHRPVPPGQPSGVRARGPGPAGAGRGDPGPAAAPGRGGGGLGADPGRRGLFPAGLSRDPALPAAVGQLRVPAPGYGTTSTRGSW